LSKPPRSARLRLVSDTMSCPAYAEGRGQGLEYFQHGGQFRCQLPVRCGVRFAGLLKQLGPQGSLVVGVVQYVGNRLICVCRDDPGDLVADEFLVAHDLGVPSG
jgi:hypothetical protein